VTREATGAALDETRETERAAHAHVVVHPEDDVTASAGAGTHRTRPLQPSSLSGAQALLLCS
jgi:hypothetical protein